MAGPDIRSLFSQVLLSLGAKRSDKIPSPEGREMPNDETYTATSIIGDAKTVYYIRTKLLPFLPVEKQKTLCDRKRDIVARCGNADGPKVKLSGAWAVSSCRTLLSVDKILV
jgi:hypothetical protein